MDCTRNQLTVKQEVIQFLKSLGIDVHTTTKALGHQGFFRHNRIDISRELREERFLPTIIHEFAHYVIYNKKIVCKDFLPIFRQNDDYIYDELLKVTNWVDKNSTLEKLYIQKENLKTAIKQYEQIIKAKYPEFKRNESFKPFYKYARFSDLRYLLKHDAVRVLHWFSYKTYSIINLEQEFSDIPKEFAAYLRLKSCQRKQTSISRKINKMNKYYNEPTELFARFVEGLFLDKEKINELAPRTFNLFYDLYQENYYTNLKELFSIVNICV